MDHVRPNKEAWCLLDRLEELQNDETGLNQFIDEQRSHFQQVKAVRPHLTTHMFIHTIALSKSMQNAVMSGRVMSRDNVLLNSTRFVNGGRKREC